MDKAAKANCCMVWNHGQQPDVLPMFLLFDTISLPLLSLSVATCSWQKGDHLVLVSVRVSKTAVLKLRVL